MSMAYAPYKTAMFFIRRIVFWAVFVALFFIETIHNTSGLLSVSGFTGLTFSFIFISVFLSFHTPASLPVIVFGIASDLYFGTVIIVSALLYMIVKYAIIRQRITLMQQGFPVVWIVFGVMTGAGMMIYWLVNSMALTPVIPGSAFIMHYLLLITVFPFLYYALAHAHKMFPVEQ